MRASCDRIDIDKQKTTSQTLRFPHVCISIIMHASYDSINNKQKMCEKVNKDITFIQFFHSTELKIFFSLLTLQLLFCKKLVGREKIENDDKISSELKDNFIDAYNNIPNKTRIQFHNKYYREYVMEPVEQYYIEKNVLADDEKSIIRDDD